MEKEVKGEYINLKKFESNSDYYSHAIIQCMDLTYKNFINIYPYYANYQKDRLNIASIESANTKDSLKRNKNNFISAISFRGEIIAIALFAAYSNKSFYISNVFTQPEYQHSPYKFATACITQGIERVFKKFPDTSIRLAVDEDNYVAQKIYTRLGFVCENKAYAFAQPIPRNKFMTVDKAQYEESKEFFKKHSSAKTQPLNRTK